MYMKKKYLLLVIIFCLLLVGCGKVEVNNKEKSVIKKDPYYKNYLFAREYKSAIEKVDKMTLEEKAKAYDELRVKAQELTEDGYIDKLALLDLFPELKESEDERIRKALVTIFTLQVSDGIVEQEGITKTDVFAWLEKQGEKDLVTCPICGWEIKKHKS